ncbi:helix-turn-helix domain-containing protein [Cohnella suwonensis]|uniref:Helix-turn-helix domain-containing protein n=1 Tax=Cohnella suwonensis TaxID=696072 RepID=A0ABW0LXM1_9BACL
MASTNFPMFHKNFVLQARSTTHHWDGTGPLSIKTFRNGRAYYKTTLGHYAVESDGYLLLNEGEHYAISIDSETEVESFCVFFRTGFADEFLGEMLLGVDKSLDDPFAKSKSPLHFHAKTYRHSHLLTPIIENLKMSLPVLGDENLWIDEQYQYLMQALVNVHRNISQEINVLPGTRPATREELFRRLTLAYEYLHAYYNRNVSLDEVSRVACLSKNHLIRNFHHFFKRTPHQFVIEKRILEAKRLLSQTERSVTEISLNVGFENVSSFNKVFKQRTGFAPQVFRKK